MRRGSEAAMPCVVWDSPGQMDLCLLRVGAVYEACLEDSQDSHADKFDLNIQGHLSSCVQESSFQGEFRNRAVNVAAFSVQLTLYSGERLRPETRAPQSPGAGRTGDGKWLGVREQKQRVVQGSK